MVDEVMANSVLKSLNYLKDLSKKTDDELKAIIKSSNLDDSNLDRQAMIETIFENFVSAEDLAYYRKYLTYVKMRKAEDLGGALDKLYGLSKRIEGVYDERRDLTARKVKAQRNIEDVNKDLISMPLIRASIAYSHVESRRARFITARTKDGMRRARFTDAIQDIKSRGVIVRALKSAKVRKLETKLKEHDAVSIAKVDEAYSAFENEVKEYCKVLRQLFYELLENKKVKRAAIMSYRLIAHVNVDYNRDDLGISEPTEQELNEANVGVIYRCFIKFADFPSVHEVDSKLFYAKLDEFIKYYDKAIKERSEFKISKANQDVANLFNAQKVVVSDLMTKRDSFIESFDFSDDESDTYSLIYTSDNNRGKKEC